MNEYYSNQVDDVILSDDDVSGIQDIYGECRYFRYAWFSFLVLLRVAYNPTLALLCIDPAILYQFRHNQNMVLNECLISIIGKHVNTSFAWKKKGYHSDSINF